MNNEVLEKIWNNKKDEVWDNLETKGSALKSVVGSKSARSIMSGDESAKIPDTFNSIIKNLEDEIENCQEEVNMLHLEDYDEDDEFIYNDELVLKELKAKLEIAKQLKEIVEKAIDKLKTLNIIDEAGEFGTSDFWIKVEKLRKALGVNDG